jgi:hypothetical protein
MQAQGRISGWVLEMADSLQISGLRQPKQTLGID